MQPLIGLFLGAAVALPFGLFSRLLVWPDASDRKEHAQGAKKAVWAALIIHGLRLLCFALVLLALARAGAGAVLGGAAAMLVSIVLDGWTAWRKGAHHGKSD